MKQIQQWYYECLECNWEYIPKKIQRGIFSKKITCANCKDNENLIFTQRIINEKISEVIKN